MHLGMYQHHDCIDGYISWSDFEEHFENPGSILLPDLGPIGDLMMKKVLTIDPFVIILLRFLLSMVL